MIVTDISDTLNYPYCIEGPANCDNTTRSTDTLHLSTILYDIRDTLSPRSEMPEEDLDWYAGGGWLWERVYDRAHQDAINRGLLIRPGEFERDGIVGSPDGLDLENSRLVELKCRWASSRKFDSLEKNFYYELLQIKSYLAMTGFTEAELTIFFVCGDWQPPIPCVRSALLEFTKYEIETSWGSVVKHAKNRRMLYD